MKKQADSCIFIKLSSIFLEIFYDFMHTSIMGYKLTLQPWLQDMSILSGVGIVGIEPYGPTMVGA